MKKAVGRLLFF